jgi:hypothetical protein
MSQNQSPMWVAPLLTGGLGNRLFQFAAAAGAAETWGRPLVFHMEACGECPHGPIASIFRMYPGIPVLTDGSATGAVRLPEPPRAFYDHIPIEPTDEPPADVPSFIHGFRQSPLYFPKNLAQLDADWSSALGGQHIRAHLERIARLDTVAERGRTVAIHVRLGDYKYLPHHQTDLGPYYARALKDVVAGQRLHLFSDEPTVCCRLFDSFAKGRGVEVTVAKGASDVEALYEMSLCGAGTITANSTFSWWGAWFAHRGGAPWATYPDTMGSGMPTPSDLMPVWGTRVSTR